MVTVIRVKTCVCIVSKAYINPCILNSMLKSRAYACFEGGQSAMGYTHIHIYIG
jgi:hypothetical protein